MSRRAWLKIVIVVLAWPIVAGGSSRIQAELPIYDLRQMVTRYSARTTSRATIGKIHDGRFYPVDSYSVGALGTTDCSILLDRDQAFPLEGMLKAKYIDQETHDALAHSANYLFADQVMFFRVLTYLSADELTKFRHLISDT